MDAIAVARAEREKRRSTQDRDASAAALRLERERERQRTLWLDRLALLMRDQSLREFADSVGLPHSSVDAWRKRPESASPSLWQLRALADKATLPGVPTGKLSLDWLCGLSEEPNREARSDFGQLPEVLAAFVDAEVARRIPRTRGGRWQSFLNYWAPDAAAIIEGAVATILRAFAAADEDLRAARARHRAMVADKLDAAGPAASRARAQAATLLAPLVDDMEKAELHRRVNSSAAPLIYRPADDQR